MARVWIMLCVRIAVLASIAPSPALAQEDAGRWPRWIAALDLVLGAGPVPPAAAQSRAAPDPVPAAATPQRDTPPVQGQSPLTAVELVERLEDGALSPGRRRPPAAAAADPGRGEPDVQGRGAREAPLPSVAAPDLQDPRSTGAGTAADALREEAQGIARRIELLRTVPPYLSRRELRVRGIRLPDEAIAQNREAALEAGRRWLAIAARLEREPRLRAAVREQMGDEAFAEAAGAIERAFLSEEAFPDR